MSHLQILPGVYERVGDPLVSRFLDMREKLRWMMAMGGERVLLYKRMYSGTYSSKWDPIRKQVQQDPNDTEGFGTPYVGGYFGPFEIFVSLKTAGSPQISRITDQGIRREFTSTSWTLWEPLLNNKDFIVRRNNQRLWINSVDISKWRHHILRQTFVHEEIERSNIIYKIPIDGLADNTTGITCPVIPPLPP
jgi:hypothetical protein